MACTAPPALAIEKALESVGNPAFGFLRLLPRFSLRVFVFAAARAGAQRLGQGAVLQSDFYARQSGIEAKGNRQAAAPVEQVANDLVIALHLLGQARRQQQQSVPAGGSIEAHPARAGDRVIGGGKE